MRRAALALLFYALPAAATAACPGTIVLSCPIGKKQLEVCASSQTATYSFGPTGRPELTITTPYADLYYQPWSGVGRAMWDAVTFENNGTGYEVWTSLDRLEGNSQWEGGVNVLKGGKSIAQLTCAPGTAEGDLSAISEGKYAAGQCWNFDHFAWQDAPCP